MSNSENIGEKSANSTSNSNSNAEPKAQSRRKLPKRLIVSLQFGGFFFALANVICVALVVYGYVSVKHEPKTLEVKGSAKKAITSDTIVWSGTITARDADLTKAYAKLAADAERVSDFVSKAGVAKKDVKFSQIHTDKVFQREVIPPAANVSGAAPTIMPTTKVEQYVLTQAVVIDSTSMEKVSDLARNVTSLIKDGVEIDSGSPMYLYSRLSELKVDMLAEATRDATTRATQITTNANGKLGKLVEAKMGVMQINPKGITAVSDTGNNDTTSLEKEILAVVTVRFELN
jgi:hypothetical protein